MLHANITYFSSDVQPMSVILWTNHDQIPLSLPLRFGMSGYAQHHTYVTVSQAVSCLSPWGCRGSSLCPFSIVIIVLSIPNQERTDISNGNRAPVNAVAG